MGIFNKLTTLVRGTARESAEILLDANAIRVFEQEVVDVEQSIQLRKQAMSEVIVARGQIEQEIKSIKTVISKREEQAAALIENNSEGDLLDEIAEDIVQYEDTLTNLELQHKDMSKRIIAIEGTLRKALLEITQYRRDLRLAKAQQLGSSGLARANNLPKQLSELEGTRRHLLALQSGGDDREAAWIEVENRIDPVGEKQRFPKNDSIEKEKRKNSVLSRLKSEQKVEVVA